MDVARFMPRVYEDDDIDIGNDANEALDASNEEEEVEREKVEPVATAAAAKRSKSRRIEEEELRPEEQGRREKQSMWHT